MRPAVKSMKWPPNIISSKTPATKSTAEPRSWLNATWPCSRASCRRWAVGSNDFSPAVSAIAGGEALGGWGQLVGQGFHEAMEGVDGWVLEGPGHGAERDHHHREREERIEAEADGDDIDLRHRAAHETEDDRR